MLCLTGDDLNSDYIDASLDASSEVYESLRDFYNMYDGCAFE